MGGPRSSRPSLSRAGSPRIDFETHIDWQEAEKFFQGAFQWTSGRSTSSAEIAFATSSAPRTPTPAGSRLRFEVPGYRWSTSANWVYGVAVINDPTYGARSPLAHGPGRTAVRPSRSASALLRAPRIPDPRQTRGRHRFTYAFAAGRRSRTRSPRADALSNLRSLADYCRHPLRRSSVEGTGVTVEAVTGLADDASGDVVAPLRVPRWTAEASLRTGLPGGRPAHLTS